MFWETRVKRAALIFLIAVGGLYLFKDNLPAGWFGFDYGPAVSTSGSFGNLGKAVDGAMKRTADGF